MEQYLAAGGILGLFAAAATVLFRSMRQEGSTIDQLRADLDFVRQNRAACEKRVEALLMVVRKGGLPIPPEVWSTETTTDTHTITTTRPRKGPQA